MFLGRRMRQGGARPVFTKFGVQDTGNTAPLTATFSNVPAGLLLMGFGSAQFGSTPAYAATFGGSAAQPYIVRGYSANLDCALFVYDNPSFAASMAITVTVTGAPARSGMVLLAIENSPWAPPADTTKFMGASTGFLTIPNADSLAVAAVSGSGVSSFTAGADDFDGGGAGAYTDGVALGWAEVNSGSHTMTANAGRVLVGAGYS